MGQITRFAVRTNGRVLADVRRPVVVKPAPAKIAEPAGVDPEAMTKAELVEMAEAKGVDTSGTKADIADRLNG